MNKAETLLHPVRLRIVQVLAAAREATTADIAATLSDVPPATLYRHLNKLIDAELVKVVDTRQVRGAMERTLALDASSHLTTADIEGVSAEQHTAWFLGFVLGLYDKFERQLNKGSTDFEAEGIGYHTHQLWLSDAELQEFAGALRETLEPYLDRPRTPECRLRSFSTVLMPEPDVPPDTDS